MAKRTRISLATEDAPKLTVAQKAWLLFLYVCSKLLGKIGIAVCPDCGSWNCGNASPQWEWRSFFRCRKCNKYFITRSPVRYRREGRHGALRRCK